MGNTLTEKGDMEQDAVIKRAKFIQSSVETRELFRFAAPGEIVKALKVYSSSFYGSNLWELNGEKARQVYTAWNTAVKLAWDCPQQTRSYLLQQVLSCGHCSARVDILSRYVKFFYSLRTSACFEVQVLSRLLARDVQSVTGKNLSYIASEAGLSPWRTSSRKIKAALIERETVDIPTEDAWRIPYLYSLLAQKREANTLVLEEETSRLGELIKSLVIN